MRLASLISGEAVVAPCAADTEISGLTADSRQVKPGYLFAALPGVNVNGARFIEKALENGAAAVLTSEIRNDARFVHADNPRRTLARAAARFYSHQPETVVAVTGTNGKTSIVSFVRQIWQAQGLLSASIGTVGVESFADMSGVAKISHTTPDPVTLHKLLDQLSRRKLTHAAIEASSHGLAQHRLDGVRLTAGAFSNISRDHLDYHESFQDYFTQKMRLFLELLPPGSPAVIDADTEEAAKVVSIALERGLKVFTVGRKGENLRLISSTHRGFTQHLAIEVEGKTYEIILPLVGGFQVSNALVAAGLVIAVSGVQADLVLRSLENLTGARGRLDLVARTQTGASVFVDYSHTPDAMVTALQALRPYVENRLCVVFGAGGDRDRGKREQMGEAARIHADMVYVTDDNPRTEDPAKVRAAILQGCPEAREISGRREAIQMALADVEAGDVVLIAGKGHEDYQEVGAKKIHFSDREEVLASIQKGGRDD